MTLILHYAPDNASLCIRLALEVAEIPYETRLVDRRANAQRSLTYKQMNPNGLIPVLMTEDGPLFETAAILLWLSERHAALMPQGSTRAAALKWLIWMSNTLHPTLRMLFYPTQYIAPEQAETLSVTARQRLADHLSLLNTASVDADWIGGSAPNALDCYLAPMLRWTQLYPKNAPEYIDLKSFPALYEIARKMENHPAAIRAARAEGLGPTPFSNPSPPNPPEGSAL